MKKQLRNNGFTFIETLVVVTLIAVLTAIGVVSYVNTTKSSRDNRRKADLQLIRAGLEMYKADNDGVYPDDLSDLETTYLASVPQDPQGNSYDYEKNGYDYCLRACLEFEPVEGTCTFAWLGGVCLSGNEYMVVSP
jgi:prepilin-type N-terminal cleavage/methylation domain-containing protein